MDTMTDRPAPQPPSRQEAQPDNSLHFLDYWRVIRSRKEIILAVTLLVVMTGMVYTITLPPKFISQSRIQVSDDTLDVAVFQQQVGSIYNPYFLRTQYEIIQSRPILYRVAENLNLAKRWGEKYKSDKSQLTTTETYAILRNSLRVDQYRDTSLIAVSAVRDDKNEAAEIANAVAEVYKAYRLELKMKEITGGLDAMRNELQGQRARVSRAEAEVERLRKELGISTIATGVRVDKIRLQQLEADRIAARVEALARKARLDQIENLSGEELINAANYLVADVGLSTLRRQASELDIQLQTILQSLGENHPDVKRLKAARAELSRQMNGVLDGLKKGVRSEYEVSQARLVALEKELEQARSLDIEMEGERFLPFANAERELERQRTMLNALEARVLQEQIEMQVPRTPVEVVDRAEPAERPFSPNYTLNIVIALLLGLIAGIGLAYFIEYLDTSIKTVDDVEHYLGLPVIGVIPQKVSPLIEEGADSNNAESYRVLRTNLLFANKGASGGAFACISGGVGEGKSTTIFNLAYVCATHGDKVLLLDADMRRPVQHSILGISNRRGLINVLMRDAPLEEMIQVVPNVPNLHVLPAGKASRAALGIISSERLREIIKGLKARYDYIFVDSPPIVGVSDASIVASEVDGVILVVQYRKYPRIMSLRAKRLVENVGGRVIGVVLNNINVMRDDYYYYYHSYYSNYYYHRAPGAASSESPALPGDEAGTQSPRV